MDNDNTYVKMNLAESIKLYKEKRAECIDRVVVLIMILGRLIGNKGINRGIYDARGVLIL